MPPGNTSIGPITDPLERLRDRDATRLATSEGDYRYLFQIATNPGSVLRKDIS
jgi:hypothetical protein